MGRCSQLHTHSRVGTRPERGKNLHRNEGKVQQDKEKVKLKDRRGEGRGRGLVAIDEALGHSP